MPASRGIFTNSHVLSAAIDANNIYVQAGGLLTSVLAGNASLPGALSSLHLRLNALGDILNAGTISSSGNLTAYAGGSIVNSLPAGATGANPIIQAANNITVIHPQEIF